MPINAGYGGKSCGTGVGGNGYCVGVGWKQSGLVVAGIVVIVGTGVVLDLGSSEAIITRFGYIVV